MREQGQNVAGSTDQKAVPHTCPAHLHSACLAQRLLWSSRGHVCGRNARSETGKSSLLGPEPTDRKRVAVQVVPGPFVLLLAFPPIKVCGHGCAQVSSESSVTGSTA